MPRPRFAPTARRGGTATGRPSGYSLLRPLRSQPQSLGGGIGLPGQGIPAAMLPSARQVQGGLRASAQNKIAQGTGQGDRYLFERANIDPTQMFVGRLQKDPQKTLAQYNLTPEELRAMMPIIQEAAKRGHPHTGLQIAMRVLNAPSNATAAIAKGLSDPKYGGDVGLLDVIQHPDKIHKLAPWNFAFALKEGFSEVPHAVTEGYTWENLIKERNNPHSFLYRHAMPIGFGLSVVADPTMYLSFGATAPSRLAAREMIAVGAEDASRVASQRAMRGRLINPRTLKPYKPDEWEQAVYDTAVELGKPMTMGDALKQLREAGLKEKEIARAGGGRERRLQAIARGGEPVYAEKLAGRKIRGPISNRIQQASAYPLALNVKGGRGIRFAGQELPGTVKAGEFLAKRVRAGGSKAMEANFLYKGLAHGLVPGAAARHITHDWLRASAGAELSRFADVQQGAGRTFDQELKRLIERPVVTGTTEVTRESRHPILDIPRSFYQKPTPEQMKMEPWRAHFSFFHNTETGQTLLSPVGSGHDDIWEAVFDKQPKLYEEMSKPGSPWIAGTGHFDHETGKIATANMNLFHDVPDEAGNIEEAVMTGPKAERMKNRVMQQARREYKKAGHAPETVQQAETTPLGQILKPGERKDILKPKPYSWQTEQQKLVKAQVEQAVVEATKKAMAAGRKQITLERSWDAWKKSTDDPLLAAARYITDLEVKYQQGHFVDRIIGDMRFSYPLRNKPADTHLPIAPREGYQRFTYKGKDYAVLSPVKDALEQFQNPQVINARLNQMLKVMNYPQNWWKIYATTPNPSFHVMNFLGAVWNNLLMGIYNPGDTVHALGTLYRSHLEQSAQAGRPTIAAPIRRLRGQAPESTPLTQEAFRIAGPEGEAGIRRGLGRSSFIWADTEQLKEQVPGGQRGMFDKAFKTPPELAEKGVLRGHARFAARRARQATAAVAAPFTGGASLVLTAPEAARIGREVGGTIEDMVRLTAFQKAARDPAVQRALEAFGPVRVPGFVEAGTHPGFTKAQQKTMYDIGAAHARHYQFDYTDLTEFERYVAKSIFPFYTYYRKNFVLQATEMIKQPRKIMAANAMMQYINDQGDYGDLPPGFKAILPEYFDNLAAFQTPVPEGIRKKLGLPEKMPLFINPKLPFVALNLFPPLWQAFEDPATPTAQKWSGIFSPLMGSWGPLSGPVPGSKVAFEAMMDYQLGLNRPIDFQRANSNDWRKSSVPAPGYTKFLPGFIQDWMGVFTSKSGERRMWATNKYIADQLATPFVANWGAAIPTTTGDPEADAKAKADLVSWMTGVRWLPADMHKFYKNYAYRLKNMLEAQQSDLRERGQELDPEDKALLHDARAAIKVAKKVDDRRQRELFPKHGGGGGGGDVGVTPASGGSIDLNQLNSAQLPSLGTPPRPSQSKSGYSLRR